MKTKLFSRVLMALAMIVLALGVTGPAPAQDASSASASAAQPAAPQIDPATLALARKYVEMTNVGVFASALAIIASQISNQIVPQHPDQTKKINQTIESVLTTYKGKDSMILDTYARLYAVTFTQAELQQIVDFYSSPVGQKLTQQRPGLSASQQQALGILENSIGTEIMTKVKAALVAEGIKP
jgi:hypothetical protein